MKKKKKKKATLWSNMLKKRIFKSNMKKGSESLWNAIKAFCTTRNYN